MTGFLPILAMAAVVALAGFLSFDGGEDKTAAFALGAILFSTAVAPLFGIAESFSLPDFSVSDLPSENLSAEVGEDAFLRGIRAAVEKEFSFSEGEVSVTARGFDFETMRAEKLRVVLSGRAAFGDAFAVRRFVEENFGSCEVDLELG